MSPDDISRPLSRRRLLQQAVAGAAGATAISALGTAAAPARSSALLRPAALQEDRVEILHWSHPLSEDDTTVFNPLIQRFQEAGNNVDVTIELVPWDGRIERKMSAAVAGTSPDCSYLNVDEFTTYVEEGALVELDQYMPEEDRADFLPGPRDAMDWNEHLYEIPVLHAFRVGYVNTDAWTASGLDPAVTPKTWPELDTALQQVKAAKDAGTHNAWPTAMEGTGSGPTTVLRNFNPWFYQAGGALVAADGTAGYGSEAGVKAAEWATYLFQTFCSEADRASQGDERRERFGQGGFVYMNNDELSVIKLMQQDFPEFKFGIANTPGDLKQWTHGGVGCFGIWVPSEQRDATWKWIDFLTRDGNLEYNQGFGFIPPRQSVRDEYAQAMDPVFARALEEQPYAGVEKHPRLWDMWDVLGPELQAAFAGSKTPAEACQTAAERINQDLLGGS